MVVSLRNNYRCAWQTDWEQERVQQSEVENENEILKFGLETTLASRT